MPLAGCVDPTSLQGFGQSAPAPALKKKSESSIAAAFPVAGGGASNLQQLEVLAIWGSFTFGRLKTGDAVNTWTVRVYIQVSMYMYTCITHIHIHTLQYMCVIAYIYKDFANTKRFVVGCDFQKVQRNTALLLLLSMQF